MFFLEAINFEIVEVKRRGRCWCELFWKSWILYSTLLITTSRSLCFKLRAPHIAFSEGSPITNDWQTSLVLSKNEGCLSITSNRIWNRNCLPTYVLQTKGTLTAQMVFFVRSKEPKRCSALLITSPLRSSILNARSAAFRGSLPTREERAPESMIAETSPGAFSLLYKRKISGVSLSSLTSWLEDVLVGMWKRRWVMNLLPSGQCSVVRECGQ